GGHDRGVDWSAFAEAVRARPPAAIVTMGQNGPRIHALLAADAGCAGYALRQAAGLGEAVAQARTALAGGGVVLLSPGAPSFGAYRDYAERGRHFAALAGFDPAAIAAIPGIGTAGGPARAPGYRAPRRRAPPRVRRGGLRSRVRPRSAPARAARRRPRSPGGAPARPRRRRRIRVLAPGCTPGCRRP